MEANTTYIDASFTYAHAQMWVAAEINGTKVQWHGVYKIDFLPETYLVDMSDTSTLSPERPLREGYQLSFGERVEVVVLLTRILAAEGLPRGCIRRVLAPASISGTAVTAIFKWAIRLLWLLCKKAMTKTLLISKQYLLSKFLTALYVWAYISLSWSHLISLLSNFRPLKALP